MSFKSLSSDGFYGWINVAAASVFMFAFTIMMQTYSLFQPEWVNEFGWKFKDTSFALMINMVVLSFLTPPVGFFISKYGSRLSIIIGSSITIIGIYTLANVNSLWHLYIGHGIVIGIGLSIGGVLAITTLINNWFSEKRSLALSIYMASMGVAGLIIAPTMRYLIVEIGWRSTYMMVIPVYFLFALLVPGIFFRNTPHELGQIPDGETASKPTDKIPCTSKKTLNITPVDFTVQEAFKTRTMWLFMGFQIINWITMGALMAHGFSFLVDIKVPNIYASSFLGWINATMIAGQMLVGFLGLRIRMQKLVLWGCAGVIISYFLMLFADRSLLIVFIYGTFAGIGVGINGMALMNLIPNYFGTKHFPKIYGLLSPVATLIGAAGAPLCGHIRDVTGSFMMFWLIAGILMTIGFIFLYLAKPPMHPSLRESRDTGYPILET